MKVLHVVPTYLPATRYGGPIYSVHGLCKALANAGVEVHVFTTNVDGDADSKVAIGTRVQLEGVNVWYFESKWLRRLYWSPGMRAMLAERMSGFDLVHVHSVFLWPTLAACSLARRAGIPYVLAPRGMLVKQLIREKSRLLKQAWIALFERRNVREASALHLTSVIEQQELDRVVPNDTPVWIVPNGVDVPASNPWCGGHGEGKVLFIGRLNWKKGLDTLVRAVAEGAPGHYVVAGNDEEGYLDVLKQLIAKHDLGDRFSFPGPVIGDEKIRLLRSADVFVMPSVNENFGIAALEAMSQGCPTIVSDSCGIAGEAAPGAVRVTDGTASGLRQSIEALLSDRQAQRVQSGAGFEAAGRFAWAPVAGEMINHYEALLS